LLSAIRYEYCQGPRLTMKAIGEVPVRKMYNKVLGLVKSREGSSPYGRGLSILANEGVASGHNMKER